MKALLLSALVASVEALSWAPPAPVAPTLTNPQFPIRRNPALAFQFRPWGSNVLLRHTPAAIDAFAPRLGTTGNTRARIDNILNVVPGLGWGNWNSLQPTTTGWVSYTTGVLNNNGPLTLVAAPNTFATLADAQVRAIQLGSAAGGILVGAGIWQVFAPSNTVFFDGKTPTTFIAAWVPPSGGCGASPGIDAATLNPIVNTNVDTTLPPQTTTTFAALATLFATRCRLANSLTLAAANQFTVVAKGRNVAFGSITEGATVSIRVTSLLQARATSDLTPACEPNFNFGQQPSFLFNSAYQRDAIAARNAAGVDPVPVYWLCPESEINGVTTSWTWGANHAQRTSYQVQTPRYL